MAHTNDTQRTYDPSDIGAAAIVGAVAGLIPGAILGYLAHSATDSALATTAVVLAAMALAATALAIYARVEDPHARDARR